MKKRRFIIALLVSITLCGCSIHDESKGKQTEYVDINEEKQDSEAKKSIEVDNDSGAGNETDDEIENQITSEVTAPTKEDVFAAKEQVLEGMSEAEIERLEENIKVANLQMERAYLNENIFEKLEDADSLYWNYFDEKGEIQIGWTYDGSNQEVTDVMKKENLSWDEFYSQYGTPVTTYNRFDAGNFIELLDEMKEMVKNEKLQDDLQQIIDETALAAKTHEMEHANNIYRLLHDMDYYLLRYGPEDVGKYVKDASIIVKYYGVLSVYEE